MNPRQIKQLWVFSLLLFIILCWNVLESSIFLLVTQGGSQEASNIKLWNLKPLASNLSYNPNLICTYDQQALYH